MTRTEPGVALARPTLDIGLFSDNPTMAAFYMNEIGLPFVEALPHSETYSENFYAAKIGDKKLLDLMQVKGKLTSGKDIKYAGGLVIDSYRGLKTVSHTGSHGGFRTILLRFPEQRFSVILLANVGDINTSVMARKIADKISFASGPFMQTVARELSQVAGS